jgi:hypothetical protein
VAAAAQPVQDATPDRRKAAQKRVSIFHRFKAFNNKKRDLLMSTEGVRHFITECSGEHLQVLRFRCGRCLRAASRLTTLTAFPCVSVHDKGHALMQLAEFIFCTICGRRAASRTEALRKQCPGACGSASTRRELGRLLDGLAPRGNSNSRIGYPSRYTINTMRLTTDEPLEASLVPTVPAAATIPLIDLSGPDLLSPLHWLFDLAPATWNSYV